MKNVFIIDSTINAIDLKVDDLVQQSTHKQTLKCIASKREYIYAYETTLLQMAETLNELDILKNEVENKCLHEGLDFLLTWSHG